MLKITGVKCLLDKNKQRSRLTEQLEYYIISLVAMFSLISLYRRQMSSNEDYSKARWYLNYKCHYWFLCSATATVQLRTSCSHVVAASVNTKNAKYKQQ